MSIDSGESSIQPGSPGVANGVSAQVGQSAATVDQSAEVAPVWRVILATSPRGVPLSTLHLVEISKMIDHLDLGGCAVVLSRGSSTWSSLVPDCANEKSRKARSRQYTRVTNKSNLAAAQRGFTKMLENPASTLCPSSWASNLRHSSLATPRSSLTMSRQSALDRRCLLSWAGCFRNGKAVRVEDQIRGQTRELGAIINGPTKQILATEGQGTSS
ncbi:uncharacterized protein VDAG_07659 [Verticillium dahliae VdLs.17]|uniref:Uncharacterized protein n=1 Tax=Verticillium dahliae (strain VdLs.17 / ATCC MYA-4575 / FGSC 10137) TaxID=498257 RepID=G2XBX7_VERDV|nr:uncharacterized protein VDAG_07659 [Verticillium dahliae VdLs.17]EGY16495.1 hypothetical protein VDAG_07659 [Verticillium dahliae VdLs.17]